MKKKVKSSNSSDYATGGATVFTVREAKAQFSALVGRAAKGEEITITWHGQSRARLAPIPPDGGVLKVNREWLRSQPVCQQGELSEDLVRADRDGKD